MDEELIPTAAMPSITVVPSSSLSFPSPTVVASPASMYPNLQQEMMAEDRGVMRHQEKMAEEVTAINGGQLMKPSSASAAAGAANNSYLGSGTSVNYSGGNVTFHSSPHRSKANRKKSRKLTLTQVCSDEAAMKPKHPQPDSHVNPQCHKVLTMEADRMSNSSSLIGFESDNSATTASTLSASSSLKSGPERKINRIFSMLQSMQQTFMQQSQTQPPPPPPQPQQQLQQPPQQQQQQQLPKPQQQQHQHQQSEHIYEQPHNNRFSDSHSGSDTIQSQDRRGRQMQLELQQQSSAPSRQLLYGLGRSQDSLMSTRMSSKNFMAINNSGGGGGGNTNPPGHSKGPIYASWNGSQYSANTYTTMTSDGAGPPPPMTHAMPYHKDGWTSLFIVASSTYAQLLIVMCVVGALSEVVTHNVSFLYFESFFAFLYAVSIVFFLYVFGYLLRSKRRREERKRLRKLSRWRESNMANPTNTTTADDETSDYDSVQVDSRGAAMSGSAMSVENEIVSAPPSHLRRFFNNFSGERRRFSRSDPAETEDKGGVSQNPLPASRKTSASRQWTMSQNFGLGGESPAEMVSYSTMTNSSDITTHNAATNGRGKAKKTKVSDNEHSHGSLFLRAGAVVFGLGTMIYDGLEFGAFLAFGARRITTGFM